MIIYTDLRLNSDRLSLYFNEITEPDLTGLILVNSGRLDGFYWYRLAGDDLSMATSEHRENGDCNFNLTRYLHRFKSIDL